MSLSVAALRPPSAIYREEQWFGWWIYALLAVVTLMIWACFEGQVPVVPPAVVHRGGHSVVAIFVVLMMPVLAIVGVLRLTTLVTPTEVRVWFGFIPTYRRAIAIGSIRRVEVVQYRPFKDYGGWGIRHGRDGERVLSARGDRGVRLYLFDGSKILIGTQRPEEFALTLKGVLSPEH